MVLSSPWYNSVGIISLNPVTKILGINPMGLSFPWDDYLVVIALHTVKNC